MRQRREEKSVFNSVILFNQNYYCCNRYNDCDQNSVSPLMQADDDSKLAAVDGEEKGRFEIILTAETLYTPGICRLGLLILYLKYIFT